MSDGDRPFRTLGWHLKLAREQLNESIVEVSGAVEVDTNILEQIELGLTRPSEDVLVMLINHLEVDDVEANSLWELAGYVRDKDVDDDNSSEFDMRIMYTDLVHITVKDSGVVINFLQAGGVGNQPLSVSRVGMSKEQANYMLKILQQTLSQANQVNHQLPPKASKQQDIQDKDK